MSMIVCPGCGGRFPLAQVAAYESFTCSTCGHVVKVPVAAPKPVAQPQQPRQPRRPARPAQPAPAGRTARPAQPAGRKEATRRAAGAPQAEPTRPARGGGRRRERAPRDFDDAPARKGPPVGLLVGGGALLLAAIAVFALTRDSDADLPPPTTIDTAATPAPGTPGAPGAGATNEAPAAGVDAPTTESAPPERVNVIPLIRQTLNKCEFADDVEADPVYRLRLLMAKHKDKKGKWIAEGDDLARVRELLGEVAVADKKLRGSDAEMARAHWVTYQRKIEVMKDYPTLHAAVGPYLIFVQIKADRGSTIDEADPEEVKKAQGVLDHNVALFRALYEGWMTEMAPYFGFERYTKDNVSRDTIFKMNVFADYRSYMEYNLRIGSGGTAASARAYYSLQEPRFICTYEGKPEKKKKDGAEGEAAEVEENPEAETREYIDQVQCHEATHQLVHFYTWDTTRKVIGRNPRWLDALTRPLWSTEGFAEFFSSHTVENGVYTWMAPLDERMEHLWIFKEILAEKDWKQWELGQMLSLRNGGQLNALGAARAIDPADRGAAGMVMGNLFYAEAWSFVYFLWYAEEGGAPKHRDKLIAYFKEEFELNYGQKQGKTGDELARSPRLMLEKDFFRVFGLQDAASRQALYDEWKVFEKDLVAKHKKPGWDKERTRIRKMLKMDAK